MCKHNYERITVNAGYYVYRCSKCKHIKLECMVEQWKHPYAQCDKEDDLLNSLLK